MSRARRSAGALPRRCGRSPTPDFPLKGVAAFPKTRSRAIPARHTRGGGHFHFPRRGQAQADGKEPSLHRRILDDVEGKILSGEWPPGHRIPFEHELTEQYQCSRMTVNKAITELVKRGLIERRRKSGR